MARTKRCCERLDLTRSYNTHFCSAVNACARIHSFALATTPHFGSMIGKRQEVLAADDLVALAIHARRLIENTVGKEHANGIKLNCVGHKARLEPVSVWRIVNVIIHHRDINIFRSRPKQRTGSIEDYLEENQVSVYPSCIVTSDEGKTIGFRIGDLTTVFESHILDPIIELCSDHRLYLDDDIWG